MSDDELGLAPIEDDAASKPVAPELPFRRGMRLVPVTCSACRTLLYAGEEQVGLWKKCPVCDRLTEIFAVPPKFILTADDPEAAGGYDVGRPEVSRREFFQIRAENREQTEEFKEALAREKALNPTSGPILDDEGPLMERLLDSLLKSDDEKAEEEIVRKREKVIEDELQAVKKASREGKLEEYFALSAGKGEKATDPAARKRAEKQRQFEAASDPIAPPPLPPSPPLPPLPPPIPPPASAPPPLVETKPDSGRDAFLGPSLWLPLLDPRCQPRMIVLLVAGLLGNLFGEKARSMIWQIIFDKVYGKTPGYSYNALESGLFVFSFWLGAVLTIVWIAMLFLFGISVFQETAQGKDRVGRWNPFSLDFGLSYFGWTLLILLLSAFPGFLCWKGAEHLLDTAEGGLLPILLIGQFLCFPILFLCMMESDMFYGGRPMKTLSSLWYRKGLWFRFYGTSLVLFGIPAVILAGLILAGTTWDEYWIMQSVFYYAVASVLLTFCGFFVLFYFRLLGKMTRTLGIEPS